MGTTLLRGSLCVMSLAVVIEKTQSLVHIEHEEAGKAGCSTLALSSGDNLGGIDLPVFL